jgi:hypothetical protein
LKKVFAGLLLLVLAAMVSACSVSGTPYLQASQSTPQLKPEMGRIFFYRPASFVGCAVRSDIQLNGEKVGKSEPGGYFYVDRTTGDYQVNCSTEVTRSLTLHLDPGQIRYIKTYVTMGLFVGHIHPELVDPNVAQKEIQETNYTGQ